eukprot:2847897-Pleurochrysis_carterae.AAC.1
MMRKVHEYAPRSSQQFVRGTAHRAAQHADGESHVRAGLRRAVKERAYQRLIRREKGGVDGARPLAGQGILHRFGQGLGSR